MRYIGSKERLLGFIEGAVEAGGVRGGVFCDLFAGTTVVGRRFKSLGYSVASNDLMRYSYVFGKAYLEGGCGSDRLDAARETLNALPPEPGFMWRHYSDEGTREGPHRRMYFSAENAGRIDAIRSRLDVWREGGDITEPEFYALLAMLLEAAPGVSNTSGTYGAFLKYWEARSQKPLELREPPPTPGPRAHRIFQRDANELLAEIAADVVYLDPPYNARQYAPNYHILETIARWDNPTVRGVTGLRPYRKERSLWCGRATALAALEHAARTADGRLFLLSYNSEGLMPDDAIRDILARRGTLTVHEQPYRRYRSDADGESRRYCPHKNIIERIYAVAS